MTRIPVTVRAILFALVCLAPGMATAQSSVDVTLFVDPFPSPYIADWEVQSGNLSLTVMNGPSEQELVVLLTLREAGGRTILTAESDPTYFTANETQVYTTISDLGGLIDYDSSYGDEILRTGRLPEGEFEICVRVEDPLGMLLSPEQCTSFTILFPDPAYLIAPFDGDVVRSASPIFQWTPLQVPIEQEFYFLLQIAEVLTGQTPYQSLTSNVLHFEAEDLTLESFEFPIEAAPLEEGKTYAWWVQALDFDGLAVTSNLGRSEIWTFTCVSDETELFPSGDPQSLRLVSADQASGPLADFDTSTFEQVVGRLNTLIADGAAIEIPMVVDGDFQPISVDGVNVYIDTQTRSLAIHGEKILHGKTYEFMFTSFWGTRADPRHKAFAIKGEEFDGFFPTDGLLDELATTNGWLIVSLAEFELKSKELPPQVAGFYGDVEIGAKRGLNLFFKVDIGGTPWLAESTDFLATDQRYLELHGFVGPTFGGAFAWNREDPVEGEKSGEKESTASIKIGAETSLTASIPVWYPEAFDGVITEMKGSLEIGAGVGLESKASTDSTKGTKTGPEASVYAQIALEATTSLQFLGTPADDAGTIKFTGALKIEKKAGEAGVELSLAISANDILKFRELEDVFSLHHPTITVSYKTGEKKERSLAFSAKADVGRYKNVAELTIKRESEKAAPDSTSAGETPPPGGVPTPFKQAELLAKEQERKDAAKKKPAPGRKGKWTVEVKFDPTALGALRPRELLVDVFNFAGNLDLLPEGPDLQSLSMTFLPDAPGSMVVAGSALLAGMPTYFLASRMRSMDGGSALLFGVVPHGWSFKQAFPDADIPLVSELELSNVGLLFATDEFMASSDDLYGEVFGFYRALYGRDDFMVNIRPGVNLIASLPVDGMDPDSPLIPLMDKLGVQKGPALLQGAIGTSVKDIYFRASLPPLSPPGAPEWFEYGQLDIELTGQPSIALVGSIAVRLDEDIVVFFVKTKAGKEGLIVAGGIDAPGGWHGPFGIEWMTINRAALLLGLTPTGSVQMGFEGDLVIGETDVRVAVLAALNVATGVPTNFMFDGESENGVSVADLLDMQANIAAAATGGEAKPIPADKLPLLGVEDLKLKFAPKDSPELNIERGLAIGGMLNMQPAPGEPADLIAAAEFDVSMDGVIARAAVGDFALGPVSLSDAAIDLTLTREEQYFRMSGAADLMIMQAAIDVDFALTEMSFDAEGEVFGLFAADVHAVGRANLTNPQFTVVGQMRNDFNDALARDLIDGALAEAEVEVERAINARNAAVSAHSRAKSALASARSTYLNTKAFPRGPKKAARNRYGQAIYTARYQGLDVLRRTAAVGVWVGVRTVLQGAQAASTANSALSVRSAKFDGDLSRIKDGQVAKLEVGLEVEGNPMTLSNAGFNFRDMAAGVADMAKQVVQKIFRARA